MPVPDVARAMRYLKPDPIPDELIRAVLDAAIRGPSGGNAQGWGWIVVTDPELKRPTRSGTWRAGSAPTERAATRTS